MNTFEICSSNSSISGVSGGVVDDSGKENANRGTEMQIAETPISRSDGHRYTLI